MRIAEVVGRLTLSRAHPSLKAGRYVVALPLPRSAIVGDSDDRGEDLVVYDTLGAGPGSWIGVGEGGEAMNPLRPAKVPIDAYCACLIDRVDAVDPRDKSRESTRRPA